MLPLQVLPLQCLQRLCVEGLPKASRKKTIHVMKSTEIGVKSCSGLDDFVPRTLLHTSFRKTYKDKQIDD